MTVEQLAKLKLKEGIRIKLFIQNKIEDLPVKVRPTDYKDYKVDRYKDLRIAYVKLLEKFDGGEEGLVKNNLERYLDYELDSDILDVVIEKADGSKIDDPDYHLYGIDTIEYKPLTLAYIKDEKINEQD